MDAGKKTGRLNQGKKAIRLSYPPDIPAPATTKLSRGGDKVSRGGDSRLEVMVSSMTPEELKLNGLAPSSPPMQNLPFAFETGKLVAKRTSLSPTVEINLPGDASDVPDDENMYIHSPSDDGKDDDNETSPLARKASMYEDDLDTFLPVSRVLTDDVDGKGGNKIWKSFAMLQIFTNLCLVMAVWQPPPNGQKLRMFYGDLASRLLDYVSQCGWNASESKEVRAQVWIYHTHCTSYVGYYYFYTP